MSFALSALDIACWDIKGKAAGRTVAQLLGGARDWAPTYCHLRLSRFTTASSWWRPRRIQVEKGIKRLKMVVGVHEGGWAEDAKRVRAVREAIGPDVELMLDANYKFSPVDAKLLCRAIEDCNLTWFEEPLFANDVARMADLRRSTRIPISAGPEGRAPLALPRAHRPSGGRHPAAERLLLRRLYRNAEGRAHGAGLQHQIANGGGWPLYNLHTMAGLMNGWRVEFHLGMQEVGEQVFVDPPKPENNIVRVGTKPGVGLEPNVEALKATQMKR